MKRLVGVTALVLLVIYGVPFVVYASASILSGLRPPTEASPGAFLLGVLVTKTGTAGLFVGLFAATREFWGPRWARYAAGWFAMFVLGEVGDAVSGRSTPFMALLGVASEAIYLPLSAFLTSKLSQSRP